ncbi:MAG: glycosyltransferase family 4 protein [Acidobacteriota bacterium]|nr:glycosyltransferase family 4 protein [Acidobacteriota bacterium]
MNRKKILVSAYACNPTSSLQLHPGEDITGWRLVGQIRRFHDVSVITHSYNRDGVEKARAEGAYPDVHFHFLDLGRPAGLLYKIEFAQRIYYYLWQIAALRLARRLHRGERFDLAHHVTFGNDWLGSWIGAFLPVPYIHGPVGGGQRTPKPLLAEYTGYGRFAEMVRQSAQWVGRHDCVRKRCLGRAKAILVCNEETRLRIPAADRAKTFFFPVNGMSRDDLDLIDRSAASAGPAVGGTFRVLTAGRLHRLKGFALAVKAFGRLAERRPDSEFRIVGKGEEEAAILAAAREAGVEDKVKLIPWLPRTELLKTMASADVLLFPSFRDGGGAVVVEAMAAGKPVVVVDSGGPGSHIDPAWGIKVAPDTPEVTAGRLADALDRLASDPGLRDRLGRAARRRVEEFYLYDREGERMMEIYKFAWGEGKAPKA